MRKRIVGIASLCCLLLSYYVCRYLLFAWHGMKEFPFDLLVVGVVVIAVSGVIKGGRIAPVFTAAGYIVGFFCGYLLQTVSYDPGGGALNNMWLIWMGFYGAAMIAGILLEIFSRKKRKEP